MEIWKISDKVSRLSEVIPYYFSSLFFSCISFSVFLIVFNGELAWLRLLPVIIYSIFISVPYLLFAVPLQIILNKHPSKFNVFYLFVYTLLSFAAVLLSSNIFGTELIGLVETKVYYGASIAAAIYWFWDSVLLQKRI
ncbi:UPF0715 family protein [Peribacillus sp. SCS-155]|uniref:UPF0715 family protein n=1 Tax=Peribacillus sedimenti TaxID=3115297 RepID=UPI0039065816